jgi:O-antigen/teichoic acid export membrane protein
MVQDTGWAFLGRVAAIALNTALFLVLARILGAREYGIFSGAQALVNTAAPYSALGCRLLYIRYVSVDRSKAGAYWGNALVVTGALSLFLTLVFCYLGPRLTGIRSIAIFALLSVVSCFSTQVITLGNGVFLANQKLRQMATLNTFCNLVRLLCIIVLGVFWKQVTAVQWSAGVFVASMLGAGVAFVAIYREIGRPYFRPKLFLARLGEGLSFSFGDSTQAVYNDLDKTMLSHYGMTRENGFYTIAYRIADFSSTPTDAIDASFSSRVFKHNAVGGRQAVVTLLLRSLRFAVPLAVVSAVAMVVLTPLVTRIIGRDFAEALVAARWLCCLPIFRAVHRLTGTALTGIGLQNQRTLAQFVVAAVNVGLNLWWIPRFGWVGAAWSSLACDALLAVLNVLLLTNAKWRERRLGVATMTSAS